MNMLIRTLGGIVAGAVAGVVLKKADSWMRGKQDGVEAPKEGSERRELFAPERRAVDHLDEALSLGMTPSQKQWASHGMKYALMALFSTVSRAVRNRTTGGRGPLLGGALFGAASYLLVEQVLEPLLGLAPSPTALDSDEHVRGLFSHAISGVADNVTRQLFQA